MRTRTRNPFLTVRTEGSILPADVLSRVIDRDKDLDGLTAESYHLAKNERINEVATRAWNRLQGAWEAFRDASLRLPENDLGTTLTRERWLLILFQELGYGRLMTRRAWELDGRTYPISHLWADTPIHLVGCRVSLDKKQAGVAGAARVSPHSLVQEFLNRSDDHLWGIVSNGLTLRLLRDNVSLTRQAYVEFDLEAMMEGEAFSDFVLLFMICHQSRVEVPEDKTPESCWLEQWHNAAAEQGIRALDTLRAGVQQAINSLGAGFLAHPANTGLRAKLKGGALSTQDYYRQLLRVVYRLLFLFVAEDRDLLYDPDAPLENRAVYANYYSTRRVRELAQRRRGTKHADLYRSLRLVFENLRDGCTALALPALGSFLFSDGATPDLDAVEIANRELLAAFRQLACTIDGEALRPIDYRNLGPEELGSVYESLLEMHPQVNTDAATFQLEVAAGSERKTTGSFYTHSSLVQCLLDSALDPVLAEAVKKPDPEAALLSLKICDPASGSGHFLIAAAHRVAKRLAAVRTGEDEPSPDATRSALRDVIGRCIYGVDINPMAVELCKISLWMEAMEPGKALGFLDHHIKFGNSLLGTTPALMADGIPNDAFKPIEGDDKTVCKDFKALNKKERAGQMALGEMLGRAAAPELAGPFRALTDEDDSSVAARERKAVHYRSLVESEDYENTWFLADAWCAAFVLPKTSLEDLAVTHRRFRTWEADPETINTDDRQAVREIADEYQFFHWHLAFPEVFRIPCGDETLENEQCGWSGGFDCVLGNPPWERIKLQVGEFFTGTAPEIAAAPNATKRRRLIEALQERNEPLWRAYLIARRKADSAGHLARDTNLYPLCGRGDVNTYALFAELNRMLTRASGRVGCIVPSGIATDDTTKYFFRDLVDNALLVSLYDFENRKKLFPGVDSRMKFCLLTLSGDAQPSGTGADFVFFALEIVDLADSTRHFSLTAAEIALLNPNTHTCPLFRSGQAAALTKQIYRRVPVLVRDESAESNHWGVFYLRLVHYGDHSDELILWAQRADTPPPNRDWALLPVYESKLIHAFDHRFATYSSDGSVQEFSLEEKRDPLARVTPRYAVSSRFFEHLLEKYDYSRDWFLAYRDVARSTDVRTVVASVIPRVPASIKLPILGVARAVPAPCLLALLNSFALDFAARQSIGGIQMSFFALKQLPVIPPHAIAEACLWARNGESTWVWVLRRTLELTYTSWDLNGMAAENQYVAPPFAWDAHRRFLIRCELDAAFFHLYLGTPQEWKKQGSKELLEYFPTPRDAVDYMMETFPIVKRKDEEKYGEFRTKLQILDIYDRMQHAIDTGEPYQTLLDPPPGPPADEHGNFLPLPEWKPGHPKPPNWPPHIHPPKEVAEHGE